MDSKIKQIPIKPIDEKIIKPLTLVKRNAWANLYHGIYVRLGYCGNEEPFDVWAVQTIDDKVDGSDYYHHGPENEIKAIFNRKLSLEDFYSPAKK